MMSSLTKRELASWRVFIETSLAMIDIIDAELQTGCGLSLRWYDVLVHLEDATEGLRMNDLAGRILASKSGLTRVIDNMDKAGLVRRERPEDDRRTVLVFITPDGLATLRSARECHHTTIQEHFAEQLDNDQLAELKNSLEHIREHVRALRPGRISS
jgi:DNA-binding MarR family transcriptional regulator